MYNVISIILMIIVAAMCILTETAGCFSKGRKEPGKGGLFTGLSDWAEKPVNSMVLLIMLFIVFLAGDVPNANYYAAVYMTLSDSLDFGRSRYNDDSFLIPFIILL